MTRALCLALVATLAVAAEAPSPRKQLFNGKDLDGWKSIGRRAGNPPGDFVVENGILKTGKEKGTLWYTREKIGNAKLRVVYSVSSPDANSGVFIRVAKEPQSEDDCIHGGFEVQISDNGDEWHRTGSLYSISKAEGGAAKPAGEWNTLDITLKGQSTIVHLNGKLVGEYDGKSPVPERKRESEPVRGPRPDSGYIAVQNHDDRAVVSFKEISLEPLR
jgi:hypothetical protein